jgi:mannose/fructose/N-acetylgalactosamine-specific phosphotransferase system component IID
MDGGIYGRCRGIDYMKRKLQISDLIRINARLAFLQSTWCEREMQSVGMAYSMLPGLKKLSSSEEVLKASLMRHRKPFNTHPFLACAAIGAALQLQEEGRESQEIDRFLGSTMGPLAALGDPFFRNALPAFVSAVSAFVAIFFGMIPGIITLLVMFNVVHLFVRIGGLVVGYKEGYAVLVRVARWLSPTRTSILKVVAAICVGGVMVSMAHLLTRDLELRWLEIVALASGLILAVALKQWRFLQPYAIPVVLAIMLILGVLI